MTCDVFLSYSHREPSNTWVKQTLLPALEGCGLRVLIDFRDFELGESLIQAMERAVETCAYTLAVMTPPYLASSWVELETLMAQHLGLERAEKRLVAVMREPCEPPLRMRMGIWLDMTDDATFPADIARLCAALKG